MWMRRSRGCKISAAKKQSRRHSKSRVGRRRVVQANCPARSSPHQTLADMEVVPPTEPKAVLEHRAPKISTPVLHTGGVESKVGRAVHCAPVWVVLTGLLGGNPTVRALTGAATARAPPCRKKPLTRSTHFCGHCGQDGRAPIYPKARDRPGRRKTCVQDGHPPNPATRRAGVHARRNNTALNTATSPNFAAPELSRSKKASDMLHPP